MPGWAHAFLVDLALTSTAESPCCGWAGCVFPWPGSPSYAATQWRASQSWSRAAQPPVPSRHRCLLFGRCLARSVASPCRSTPGDVGRSPQACRDLNPESHADREVATHLGWVVIHVLLEFVRHLQQCCSGLTTDPSDEPLGARAIVGLVSPEPMIVADPSLPPLSTCTYSQTGLGARSARRPRARHQLDRPGHHWSDVTVVPMSKT